MRDGQIYEGKKDSVCPDRTDGCFNGYLKYHIFEREREIYFLSKCMISIYNYNLPFMCLIPLQIPAHPHNLTTLS